MSATSAQSAPASVQPIEGASRAIMRRFAFFFFFSGFCSLLYEVVWLRLGMASFGVTTPIVSLFLSVFMAGLGLGSWAAGTWMKGTASRHALRLYAFTEFLIGIAALVVPVELVWARHFIEHYGSDLALSSGYYFFVAGGLITLILLPWATCMGATFPFAMAAIRRYRPAEQTSFSFLYLANVLGALAGSLIPAFILIEIFGFHRTLKFAAMANFLVSALAFALSFKSPPESSRASEQRNAAASVVSGSLSARGKLALLFLTGLNSLAMEIVWIRQFTPYMGTEVYTFAWILGCYLIGTFVGSRVYRRWLRKHAAGETSAAWLLLGTVALLPLLMADPRFDMLAFLRIALGIIPITALLGFVTPQLVDQYSQGDPDLAGRAYAVNVVGCILGPLLAGFFLLPPLGERWSLVLLSVPFFALLFLFKPQKSSKLHYGARFYLETAAVALALIVFTKDYIILFSPRRLERDYAATTIATGEGMNRELVVNGVNLTVLTPITKYMAHMPLAFLNRQPRNALVICFGMGTTHRSLLTWNIPVTAVELLPSVSRMYGYYHPDGPALLRSPNSHLVIDDGRLFLEKSKQQFDVITIDPPPPVSAAGVSFLYTREFYQVLKPRLAPDGVLQQWASGIGFDELAAIGKALRAEFPYVRAFISVTGEGLHFFAAAHPIPNLSPAELAARLPAAAQSDLVEWGPTSSAEQGFRIMQHREIDLPGALSQFPLIGPLDDDRPINEYHLLRHHLPPRWRDRLLAFSHTLDQ